MSRTPLVIAILAVLVLAGLTACGSDDSGDSNASSKAAATSAETTAAAPAATEPAPATTSAPATTTTTAAPTPEQDAKVVATCHKTFDPYIAELRRIDKVTANDASYARYRAVTSELEKHYSKLRTNQIPSSTCQHEVNVMISSARLTHRLALSSWKACRKQGNCKTTMVKLKQQWRNASKFTDTAAEGFDKVSAS